MWQKKIFFMDLCDVQIAFLIITVNEIKVVIKVKFTGQGKALELR